VKTTQAVLFFSSQVQQRQQYRARPLTGAVKVSPSQWLIFDIKNTCSMRIDPHFHSIFQYWKGVFDVSHCHSDVSEGWHLLRCRFAASAAGCPLYPNGADYVVGSDIIYPDTNRFLPGLFDTKRPAEGTRQGFGNQRNSNQMNASENAHQDVSLLVLLLFLWGH
jgi:hypothetical protein